MTVSESNALTMSDANAKPLSEADIANNWLHDTVKKTIAARTTLLLQKVQQLSSSNPSMHMPYFTLHRGQPGIGTCFCTAESRQHLED